MFCIFSKTIMPVILLFTFFFTCNSVNVAACDNGGIINIFSGKGKAGYLAAYNKPGEKSTEETTGTAKDSLLSDIPERAWRTPGFKGRELTGEIAEKYPKGNFIERKAENNVWGTGEHIIFSVDYGFYRAGTATMSVVEKKDVNGGLCYHIKTTARSNEFISKFYEVRDTVNSYIDADGLFSRRFEKRLSEGKYKSDRIVDFYHDRLIALNTRKKYALTEIPLHVQDILSSLYYIRTRDLKVGQDEIIDVYADGKVYPLKVIVHKKEKVKVSAGTFDCLKIEPVLQSEGVFKQKGKLTVWLTDDKLKIPVKMKSKILIGSIGTNMESYTFGTVE